MGLVPFVGEEMFHRRQQKRPKPSPMLISLGQPVPLQHPGKELLGEVLGVVRIVAGAPDEGVERIPVSGTEFFQGGLGLGGIVAAGSEHDRPVGSNEASLAR
jgi:hypothetical protein